jgi:hypothetical protein
LFLLPWTRPPATHPHHGFITLGANVVEKMDAPISASNCVCNDGLLTTKLKK